MILLDNFLAYGTHMKIEKPGKGCVVAACEELEPPVVRLLDGSVIKVRTLEQAEAIKNQVAEILFLGDILVTYGDFLKCNHPLLPSGYCREWWEAEARIKGINIPETLDAIAAFEFSKLHSLPLHPDYTYHWHDLSSKEIKQLSDWLLNAHLEFVNNKSDGSGSSATTARKSQEFTRIKELIVPISEAKKVLESLLVEHRVVKEKVIVNGEDSYAILSALGMLDNKWKIDNSRLNAAFSEEKSAIQLVNELAGVVIKPKAPTYIGARMGRPEKGKERKMDGSPNVLFPTGSMKNRSLSKLYRMLKAKEGTKNTNLQLSRFRCNGCAAITFYRKCDVCGENTFPELVCSECGKVVTSDEHCGKKTLQYDKRAVNLVEMFDNLKSLFNFIPEDLKGVKGLSNAIRIPERLEKGFLRAKYNVYVFRDGTSRFDATDIPLTHFTPKEIALSVENAIALGYKRDYLGNQLKHEDQLLPLKCQDIVLSEDGGEYFLSVGKYIDELLINLYGLKPFYNLRSREDLIGHLAVGLSPHTSAAVLCRIIGFTKANVGYAHPYFHSAKRRNADGDEDSVMLLMDSLLNFSRKYLNEKRGGTMDAPLVLTPHINPGEVDDEVHCMEFVNSYPLEFYQAAERITLPTEIKLRTVKDVLGKAEQYEQLPLTHPSGFLDKGNTKTAYVTLESIPDKISMQFRLQSKLRPVDQKNAAERLVLSHFIPDLYGNLRSFSRQTFRCVNCNEIFRRPPLIGKCTKCGGNLLLTINKGWIEKYLQISRKVISDFDLPDYLKQRLDLLEKEIKSVFEDDHVKQTGLADFL